MRETPRLLIDDRHRPLPLVVATNPAEPQHLGEHADLRERRAQLVRHARHELALHARELPLTMQLQQRHDHESRAQRDEPEHEL